MAALLALAGTGFAAAETAVKVEQAWIRAAPPGAMMLAGYARLINAGSEPVVIRSASSAAFEVVEFHRTVEEDGVSKMRAAGDLELQPQAEIALEPGGLHLMLMRPRQEIREGATVVIDLLTAEGDIVPAVFSVRRSAD